MDPDSSPSDQPPVFNYILSFLLVGVAWGFTTPFIRRAAADFNARQEQLRLLQTELQPAQSTSNDGEPDRNSSDPAADSESESESESDEDQPLPPPPPPPPPGASATTPRPAWMHTRPSSSWLKTKIVSVFWTVVNLLRTPAYLIPLVINLTGSVWFFLLVGQHELSLTVPLANSSAFLFTVLGEWYVERKVIAKETWLGMALVLGGVAICVRSKA
ncbi:hypothetical protein P175DRAFT_0498323 [Aspergillus ochraceoroseus IBT 24754]|uniref:EamA domain-containing protein n=1 Tax=Aspergillus ochraceoroseus IBT 24754 TaxID=1392256 RepID=A0A2T5M9K4_9EURO|nr:uncharacterized protein P175DRAFT_0498323 [Aspergillus ochraceoroseus IBT 24754]PTU25218.1 hypothetical protein P175DRAFT_0498323 [Aspergillus ochraceoroseus IBT 24754]